MLGHSTGTPRAPRRTAARRTGALLGVVAVALGGTATAAVASVPRTTAPQLQATTVKPYTGILANAKRHSLYALSNESKGKLHCTGMCLTYWPPLLVSSSTKSVTVGKGVKGKIGFVKRSSTTKQVTFNGFPLYRYSGDTGAGQVSGEAIAADGGTWYLVSAAATTTSATQVKPKH